MLYDGFISLRHLSIHDSEPAEASRPLCMESACRSTSLIDFMLSRKTRR